MKRRIFFKDEHGYGLLYEINRKTNDLYINCLFSNTGKHFTYHGSGVSGHKFKKDAPRHSVSKRPKINEYVGTESVLQLNVLSPFGEDIEIGQEDLVVEITAPFCVEVIISGSAIDLPSLVNRETIAVAQFLEIAPFVLFEFYRPISDTPIPLRYPRVYD